jgi:hypothetical protein
VQAPGGGARKRRDAGRGRPRVVGARKGAENSARGGKKPNSNNVAEIESAENSAPLSLPVRQMPQPAVKSPMATMPPKSKVRQMPHWRKIATRR